MASGRDRQTAMLTKSRQYADRSSQEDATVMTGSESKPLDGELNENVVFLKRGALPLGDNLESVRLFAAVGERSNMRLSG